MGDANGETKDDVRMASVKDAARILVDILGPDVNDPAVAVGLVPWHQTVRLGETDAARWDSNGWAEYPQEKMYPLPYSFGSPVTRTMPGEPANEWQGCLDRRHIGGSSSPGLSTTTPSDSPVPKGFYSSLGGPTEPPRGGTRGRDVPPPQPGADPPVSTPSVHESRSRFPSIARI